MQNPWIYFLTLDSTNFKGWFVEDPLDFSGIFSILSAQSENQKLHLIPTTMLTLNLMYND